MDRDLWFATAVLFIIGLAIALVNVLLMEYLMLALSVPISVIAVFIVVLIVSFIMDVVSRYKRKMEELKRFKTEEMQKDTYRRKFFKNNFNRITCYTFHRIVDFTADIEELKKRRQEEIKAFERKTKTEQDNLKKEQKFIEKFIEGDSK